MSRSGFGCDDPAGATADGRNAGADAGGMGGVSVIGAEGTPLGPRLASAFRKEVPSMESERTQDSVEQVEQAQDLPNPITDEDAELGEAGDAAIPQGEAPEEDKDSAEGPAPHATQMPR